MKTVPLALALLLALACGQSARADDGKILGKLAVVAAENFYGDIARRSAASVSMSSAS